MKGVPDRGPVEQGLRALQEGVALLRLHGTR